MELRNFLSPLSREMNFGKATLNCFHACKGKLEHIMQCELTIHQLNSTRSRVSLKSSVRSLYLVMAQERETRPGLSVIYAILKVGKRKKIIKSFFFCYLLFS